MKKTFITISMLSSSVVLASGYVVVVDKENNEYKTGETKVSPWIETSNICVNDNEASDFYAETEFEQIETCTKTEERTKTEKTIDSDGLPEEKITIETRKTSIVSDPVLMIGTHMESSCQNIKMNGYSSKDGYFKIKRGEKEPIVFCDMENGAWTFFLTTSTKETDWKNINWNTGFVPIPSFNHLNYQDIIRTCEDKSGLPVFADYQKSTGEFWHIGREFLKNETNWFDSPAAGDGGGIALGLKWDGAKWLNNIGGTTTIISASGTDLGDNCTGNLEVCGYWDQRDNNPTYGYGAGPEDWGFNQTSAVLCGGLLEEDSYKEVIEYTEWVNNHNLKDMASY